MSTVTALSAALHFDHELAADPAPFAVLVRALFGERSSDGAFRQFFVWADGRKPRPPASLELARLLELVRSGQAWLTAVETEPGTPADLEMRVAAGTTPHDKPARSVTRCRYNFDAVFGAARLDELGARRVLDLVIAFGDAVAARAGVVHWAAPTIYAACLASCGGSSQLTPAQSGHIQDLMYWQPRWGDVIRGPQWGTFLGAAHVATLGGIARIEREAPCARVVALGSGGAFLEATPIDRPLFEDRGDPAPLAELARFLAPVMGTR